MSEDEFIPTLSHATERDVDLLLVEELYASPSFVAWMAGQAGISRQVSSATVLHSKRRTRSRREIDIFVEADHPDGARSALLIENKLDATEQPDQAESYRAELDMLSGGYGRAAMLIVCPAGYAAQHAAFTSKFDAVVTYEALASRFLELAERASGDMASRYAFRAAILDQAVHKHRRGYVAVPNETVGDFNARYVALLSKVAPEIRPGKSMLKPANPDESTSMIFDQDASLAGLPHQIRPRRFSHEFGRGSERRANYVAVTFGGWGAALPAIGERLEADAAALGATFSAKPPTKARPNPGLVMSVRTKPVDNQSSFEAQRQSLTAGIERASEMRHWLLSNRAILWGWKQLVDQHAVDA